MQQRQKIVRFLFVAHQQFPKTVEPRMRAFHLPPPGRALATTGRFGFLADLRHVGNVAARPHDRGGRLATVAFVGTQVLAAPPARLGPPNHNAVQGLGQQFHIMPVGPADDKRERDASPVDQQAAFGAFFSPDPWGCCPTLPVPTELCLARRQCSAIPRRSPPVHRIPPNPLATVGGRSPPRATVESADARHWRCQNFSAGLSTGSPCARHTRWRQTRRVASRACVRPRDGGDIYGPWPAPPPPESTLRHAPKVHRTLPRSKFCACPQRATPRRQCKAYLGISSGHFACFYENPHRHYSSCRCGDCDDWRVEVCRG